MQEILAAAAERRIERARKSQAESLDLSALALRELPASLGVDGLQKLKSLDLRLNMVLTDLSSAAGLQGLQSLDLRDCRSLTNLAPLVGLQGLQSLNLQECWSLRNLAPLVGLQGLQSLILSSTGVWDLAPLAGLQELQSLNLIRCLCLADLGPLAGLQGLRSLNLAQCLGVTDLTPLAGLQGLQNLYLSSTNVTDLAPLAGLQGLQSLNLAQCTGVKDLTPLAGLQGLRSLSLPLTGVRDLAPLAGLQGLQSLDLSLTWVTDLAPLTRLQGLQSLKLFGCRLTLPALRALADHESLTDLTSDRAVGVPEEVLSHRPDDNCLPRLRTYFSELDLGAEAENEVKVILLGNGRVGKTQLCRRFRGQPFDESVPSTHGVQIWREELHIRTGGEENVFQVNWWDFGGQDIYHGTHALFLHSRAVFLILWAPQLENRDEYDENGIPLRNQPLAYWLDYVRSLAGEGSPVIVVQSQCDRPADRRSDPPRPDDLELFECCAYSARTDLGRDPLEALLREAIRYLLARSGALAIGQGRAEVRRKLYDWRSEDQERPPAERRHRTLTLDELRALCDETGGIVSWEHALDYFHHTGVVFYRPDLFSDRIVLDQTWALDAVYTVFHRGKTVPWLRDSGRFTREDLASMVWQEHSAGEQNLFLNLMQSCGVCFPCGETVQREKQYIAPDLLPRFEAIRLPAWKGDLDTPTLRLNYRFFHPAVIRNLMSTIGQRAGDLAEYWKYGLWVKDGRRDAQLLVQFEDTSTDEEPGAGALVLKAEGRDPLGLLREIRRAILWQWIGEEPEELWTVDGTTVARRDLGEARAISEATEATVLDIDPQPLTASEKPCEVFISYAWGDETPEGKIRAQAVDGLCAALEKDGFLLVRDRDTMRPGDRISAFMRRLTRADHVVAVVSDKYLRSSYCMNEIHGLWQRNQEDADLMAECLVPVMLPEVKIEGLRDRARYVRYWREQKKELERLFRELGPDLDPETLRELRLVRRFAQEVDGILRFLQDVLMTRKLEAQLDDGFQAVSEALRRRMGPRPQSDIQLP